MARARLEVKPHDGRSAGVGAHKVIGRLLTDGIRNPTPAQIFEYAGNDPSLDAPHVYRLSARSRLITATAVYFTRFAPESSWHFVGSEFQLRSRSLDLLWRTGRQAVISDELKTGIPDLSSGVSLDEQLEKQLWEAIERFGRRFKGVRVLFTAAPARSFFLAADGSRASLEDAS